MVPTRSNPTARWFAGFFGALFAVAVLPRALVLVLKRMTGRILAEVLLFLALGFISERITGKWPVSTRKRP